MIVFGMKWKYSKDTKGLLQGSIDVSIYLVEHPKKPNLKQVVVKEKNRKVIGGKTKHLIESLYSKSVQRQHFLSPVPTELTGGKRL